MVARVSPSIEYTFIIEENGKGKGKDKDKDKDVEEVGGCERQEWMKGKVETTGKK